MADSVLLLKQAYDRFAAAYAEADAKIGFFQRLFASSLPETEACFDDFIKNVEDTVSAAEPQELNGVFRFILESGASHLKDEKKSLTYLAPQRTLLNRVQELPADRAAEQLDYMQKNFPRRYRVPVTEELIRALRIQAEKKP